MPDFIKVALKGQDYTFTALDFGQLQELEADFDALRGLRDGAMPDATQRNAIVAICHASLQGRHSDLTPATVGKLLTLANIGPALQAVAGVSGTAGSNGAAEGEAGNP